MREMRSHCSRVRSCRRGAVVEDPHPVVNRQVVVMQRVPLMFGWQYFWGHLWFVGNEPDVGPIAAPREGVVLY